MPKTDRSVVRNQPYRKSSIGIRERHNERKNEVYSNPDIISERSYLNVHFKKCEGTYTQVFDKMLEAGTISMRGLKENAYVFEEMVFDVNTAYFDRSGGYEYTRAFFEEAYRLAVKEAGSDQYVLSAIMHADERNRALSEELGRDVFHYHLHVVYIPVVEKVVKWSKRCKDKSLVGTTKEIIHQVSHSKKWASGKAVDEHGREIRTKDGKAVLVNSYSLLQDRFFEHMRAAGYTDFERGERGSTAEHLSVLDYKIKQDMAKVSALDEKIQTQKNNLSVLRDELKSAKAVCSSVRDIDEMGKRKLFGKVELTEKEYSDLTALAKEGVTSRFTIRKLSEQLNAARGELLRLKSRFNEVLDATKDFREAVKLAPQRVKELFSDIFLRARETQERKRTQQRYSGRNAR